MIDGGSEHSDSVWYFVGCVVRGFQVFAAGASSGSQTNGGIFYK